MTTRTWAVVEDNGGGLHLYVFADDRVIYGRSGLETLARGYVRAHVHEALAAGVDPIADGWDGDNDAQSSWDALTEESRRNGGWRIIADQDGAIALDHMGAAGRHAFGPSEE